MKRNENRIVLMVLVISFFIWSSGNAQMIASSISDILRNPYRYDGKMVSVEGTIKSVKIKTTKRGNPYVTFNLEDPAGKSLSVFSLGVPPIKGGDRAKISGKYHKAKTVSSRWKFHNTIDASNGGVERIEQ